LSYQANATVEVLLDIKEERQRQVAKWGVQHGRPDGLLGRLGYQAARIVYTRINDARQADGVEGHWDDILLEEVYEALSETDRGNLRTELIQVAAVCAAWVEALDAR
jgi:hypothetical protein